MDRRESGFETPKYARSRAASPGQADGGHPLLLMKELESLERLVEKISHVDLHAGQGLDALLSKLVRLKAPQAA